MLAGAVRKYLNRFSVVPGRRIAIAGNNDSVYQTAFDLVGAGIKVAAVIDERETASDELKQRLDEQEIPLFENTRITDTRGTRGIRQIRLEMNSGETRSLDCDLLAVSGGWAPRIHLLCHAGGGVRFDPGAQCFVPEIIPEGLHVAGCIAGPAGLPETFASAAGVTQSVCESLGVTAHAISIPRITREIVLASNTTWTPPAPSKHRQWIDLAHDVTTQDAGLAVREGFESVEHFKRYTTAGMSVDQGKTSNTNAFLVLSALTDSDPGKSGTTTFRPPYSPVSASVIAAQNCGELYAPHRHLPAHAEHLALGAHFEDFGWQRPEYYPRDGESPEAAITREVLAVRSGVGVFDNSPIGKLEVCGPDAAVFLDRLYINNIRNLSPGKARYGLMLNENGVIIDDGVVIRLATDHFIVHTTSANAQRVAQIMEEWLQCEWTDLMVVVHDATSHWANFTIAGPKSREVLAALDSDIDVSAESLPHMSATTGHILGVETRISRVSYSGELSFELNVPASYGPSLFKAVLHTGKPQGITPFGVEALMVLRTEKGYLHVGSDTDGSTTPDDVGWGEVARRKDRDFIGRRSLFRPANTARERKQLVGLEFAGTEHSILAGGHLLLGQDRRPPAATDGWVTSACFSPTLERYIALAMLRDGRKHHGKSITVYDQGRQYGARVVAPVFYDPQNTRLS
jgi:sarcosine oxidase subunit alpha